MKGIVIGAALAALVAWWAGYGEMIIHASPLANDYLAPVAFFLFFVVAFGANGVLRRFIPACRLRTGELVTIFVMLLAAAAIPTRGFVSMIGPVITGAQYYGRAENQWDELVLPHVVKNKWIVPQGEKVAEHYYEGAPKDEGVPWGAWARPVLSWLALCLGISFMMVCVAAIFRKQWVERERIIYPMMQLPIELARSGEDGNSRPIWHSRVLWIGFAIPFLMYTYQGLAHYFPDYLDKMQLHFGFPLFHGNSGLRIRTSPVSFAFLFFVRSDVLMGLAVFPFVVSVAKGWMRSNGFYPQVPALGIWSYDSVEAFFGMGALIIFVVRIIYFARRHLGDVFSSALGIGPRADDSNEIMSYRTAVFGLLFATGFVVFWLVAAGMAIWQALLYLALAFMIFLALTRVIAEAGLPTALPPAVAGDFLTGIVGAGAMTPANLTGMGFTYPFHSEMRCFLLSHCANGLKVSHEALGRPKRGLLWGILLAVTVSFLVAMGIMIYFPYRDGGLNLHYWTFNNTAKYSWMDASSRIMREGGPVYKGFPLMGYGATLMVLLMACAHWIPRWPLHPGALVVSFHWAGQVLWSSAVAALVAKALVLRYGGAGVFRALRPFLYGLILGEVVTASLWVVVDGLTGMHNNYLTSFF